MKKARRSPHPRPQTSTMTRDDLDQVVGGIRPGINPEPKLPGINPEPKLPGINPEPKLPRWPGFPGGRW